MLLLLNYVVLRALCKIDLISTLVNKSLYYYYYLYTRPSDVTGQHCLNTNGRHFFSRFISLSDESRCLAAYMSLIIVGVSLHLHNL